MTEKELRVLKAREKRYKVYLGESIYVEIMPSGKKYFRLKKGNITKKIGESPSISIREAKNIAYNLLLDLEDSLDFKSITFEKLFEEFISRQEWAEKTLKSNMGRINLYILPELSKLRVREIKRAEILAILRKIEEQNKLETASKVLGLIRQILDYAVVCGYVEHNCALGLAKALKASKIKPMAALTREYEIKRLMVAINMYEQKVVQSLLLFTIYTLGRPSECRLATWDEIEGDIWTVPASRMKLRKEHVVPLSRQCLEIIEGMKAFKASEYIFPSIRPNRPLSDNALLTALRTMGFTKEETSVHGFRSMGSTVLNEKGYRPDVIEKALAHAGEDRIRAIYNRAEYLEERKNMLQDYADYLDGLVKE